MIFLMNSVNSAKANATGTGVRGGRGLCVCPAQGMVRRGQLAHEVLGGAGERYSVLLHPLHDYNS